MATAHVQTKDAQSSSGGTVAVSLTSVGAGNHLYAVTGVAGTTTIAPTSTPSATWSNAVADFVDAATDHLRADYSQNLAIGGSWTVNCNATTSGVTGMVSESSGVATSASLGAVNNAIVASSNTHQPGSITPAAGSILYTSVTDGSSQTLADTINSSFLVSSSSVAWNSAGSRCGQAHSDNVAAVAVNPTWTLPNAAAAAQGALIVEFKAAAGGGTGLPFPMQQELLTGGMQESGGVRQW